MESTWKKVRYMLMAGCISLFLALSFMSGTALAVQTEDEVSKETSEIFLEPIEGKYSYTYQDAEPGNMYAILVVAGIRKDLYSDDILESDLLYVDQKSADSENVSFNGFIPMEDKNATVFITGADIGAITAGYIVKDVSEFKFSVTYSFENSLIENNTLTVNRGMTWEELKDSLPVTGMVEVSSNYTDTVKYSVDLEWKEPDSFDCSEVGKVTKVTAAVAVQDENAYNWVSKLLESYPYSIDVIVWDDNQYMVSFDTRGGSHISPCPVTKGDILTPPENPVKKGYTFTGWYKEETCKNKWDFKDVVQGDMTLYAGWKASGEDSGDSFKVTFNYSNAVISISFKDNAYTLENNKIRVLAGTEVSFKIEVDDRYEVASVKAGGNDVKVDEKDYYVITVRENTEIIITTAAKENSKEPVKPDGILRIEGLKGPFYYTGAKIIPDIKVYDDSISTTIPLAPGIDYTVKYKDNVKVSTDKKATVIVTGKGNYKDKNKEGYFTIKKDPYVPIGGYLDLKGAKLAKIDPVDYNTQAQYPDFTLTLSDKSSKTYTYSEKGYYVEKGTTKRIKAKVTVSNNINKGTATILITGAVKKNKATTVKKTFKITPIDIRSATVTPNPEGATYAVKGAVPSVTVTIKVKVGNEEVTETLREGIDFTAKYTSNKKAGSTGVIKITGKGNYTKKAADVSFNINTLEMTDLKIAVAAYEGVKADKVKATVLDPQGNALKASQYKVEVSDDEQFNNIRVDKLNAGEEVYVRAVANDTTNLTKETATESVKVKVGKNFAKAKVKLKKDSAGKTITKTYTGRSIGLEKNEIEVTMKGVEITAYEIVGYTNNVKKGTATAILQGTGEYTGTKTVKFKIVAKSMSNASFDNIKTNINNFINDLLN